MTNSAQTLKVVSALVRGTIAQKAHDQQGWSVGDDKHLSTLAHADADKLISHGVLKRQGNQLIATPFAKTWLRKNRLDQPDSCQTARTQTLSLHEEPPKTLPPKTLPPRNLPTVNINESPLSRLASQKDNGVAFLSPEMVAAGDWFRQLFERSQMQPRITLSYDPTHLVDKGAPTSGNPLGDMGHDARSKMNDLLSKMPKDAASAVLNVCGFQTGIQRLEVEKNWPRRSGKMILRLGLEILASEMGFLNNKGPTKPTKAQVWRPEESVPNVLR